MSPLVINIKPEYESILGFLFPTYALVDDNAAVTTKFIIHKDIKSAAQRDALSVYYSDCVFISHQLFDEFWTEDVIKQKCVEFARKNLRSRKSKLEVTPDTLVSDCIDFMFDLTTESEEASINELFDAFGSASFVKTFFQKSETIPVPRLQAALNTFITKILQVSDASSTYYKKKAQVYGPKIRANFIKALDEFMLRPQDSQGLSVCKFYASLFQ